MIDSSALLLTIVMTTPVASLETGISNDYVSVNTLDGIMQRLCWPHSAKLSMQCDNQTGQVSQQQDEQAQNLMKALNSIKYIKSSR